MKTTDEANTMTAAATEVEAEATAATEQTPEAKATKKAKFGNKGATAASAKGKASKRATSGKSAPKAKQAAKEATGTREGSKTAQVVAMLQRKNGVTQAEIMQAMGWQAHTVRGFMAGAMKKAGHQVESFKPEGGERTYRISK